MKQQGFTLLELLIVAGIIMMISQASSHGINATKYWLEPKRILSVILEIRNIAITNRQPTVLCPSADSYECIKNWQLPLMVFIDVNNNKKRDLSESIIQIISPYTGIERTIEYPRTQIRFNAQGQINGYTGTLKYCSKYNTKGIVLSRIGRIRYIQHLGSASSSSSVICSN
jgi:type IV fimbrial biogenesis protein FimT